VALIDLVGLLGLLFAVDALAADIGVERSVWVAGVFLLIYVASEVRTAVRRRA
jgi:hypothetical protein